MNFCRGDGARAPGVLLVLAALVSLTHAASRTVARAPVQPMGRSIAQAEAIVIANTQKENEGILETVLSIREVIKGDAALAGQSIKITRTGSSSGAALSAEAKGLAVLLRPGWKEAKSWPVLQTFQKPNEIEALRILTPLCSIENERERLLALGGIASNKNALCQQELFAQLRDVRSAANFDILTNLYPTLEPWNQVKLVELVGDIGDPRGVPLLLEAVVSTNKEISVTAVEKLRSNFPGAPGVAEAFQGVQRREHLARLVGPYLARYKAEPKPAAAAAKKEKESPSVKAMRQLASGKTNEARAAYLKIVKDVNERYRTRLNAATVLIENATEDEKKPIRQSLVAAAALEENVNDYLAVQETAEILRALRHPDCARALLPILRLTSASSTKAVWTATMAIRELGKGPTQKAVYQTIKRIELAPVKLRYPLELLWLGDKSTFEEARVLMHVDYTNLWRTLRPLQGLADATNEVAFLVEQLAQRSALPTEATEWILLRLGDLKDKSAIPELVSCFTSASDPRLAQGAGDALVAVGGPETEAELTKRLSQPDEGVRRRATEALFKLAGQNSRELALRVLSDKSLGWKPAAYLEMGEAGTADDLTLLASLADYWTGDRANHYWASTALRLVRERCHHDMNGPIKGAP